MKQLVGKSVMVDPVSDDVRVPQRTCVGCRARSPRDQLIRFVLRAGKAWQDPRASAHGRGAWLHPDQKCREAAVRKGGFTRAFRARISGIELIES